MCVHPLSRIFQHRAGREGADRVPQVPVHLLIFVPFLPDVDKVAMRTAFWGKVTRDPQRPPAETKGGPRRGHKREQLLPPRLTCS